MGKSHIIIIPSYTVHEINMQYIIFHPIYKIGSNALLILLANERYGRGGLTLKDPYGRGGLILKDTYGRGGLTLKDTSDFAIAAGFGRLHFANQPLWQLRIILFASVTLLTAQSKLWL